MSVVFETSMGDLVIDLFTEECPQTCLNFLKLCKVKYYNNCIVHNIQKDYIVQTGDPTGTGKGGDSVFGLIYGEQARYFDDEIRPQLKHNKVGVVGMASKGPNLNASQFYITVSDRLPSLDGKHTVFGEVAEGLDILMKINEVFTDDDGHPLRIVRIRHTVVLDDPFPDPKGLEIPNQSPPHVRDKPMNALGEDEEEEEDLPEEEIRKRLAEKEAKARAEVLAMIGDLPDAEVKPPENVLFVCKLNPVTRDQDLELIFSRFGEIKSCEVIRDKRTGESLCFAFVEFANRDQCEEAYFKMNNVLIDDRRIHVDFSQSVSKMVDWRKEGGWRNYFAAQAKQRNREGNLGRGGHHGKPPAGPVGGISALQMRGGGGGRSSYGLMFDGEEEEGEPAPKRQKVDESHRSSSHRDDSSRHPRDRDRDRDDRRHHHHRDGRDRDRDSHRDRDRASSSRSYRPDDRERTIDHSGRDRDRDRDHDRHRSRDR